MYDIYYKSYIYDLVSSKITYSKNLYTIGNCTRGIVGQFVILLNSYVVQEILLRDFHVSKDEDLFRTYLFIFQS